MRQSHACELKTVISRIKGNFSRLTYKSGPVVLNNHKSFQMSTIRSNRKCSKVVEIYSDILGNVRKSSENRRKSLEVAWTFSKIPLMTRQKFHTFDSKSKQLIGI